MYFVLPGDHCWKTDQVQTEHKRKSSLRDSMALVAGVTSLVLLLYRQRPKAYESKYKLITGFQCLMSWPGNKNATFP